MIKCEVCGSNNIIKQNGVFCCQSCGISYTLEEVQRLLRRDPSLESRKSAVESVNAQSVAYGNSYEKNRLKVTDLKVGDILFLGTYQFFSDKEDKYPIEWIIIDDKDQKYTLTTRYLIDYLPYNTNSIPRNDINTVLNSDGDYQFIWHNSSIRKWLNNDFYVNVFNNSEKYAIIPTRLTFPSYIEDSDDCICYEFGGKPEQVEALPETTDKVFLMTDKDYLSCYQVLFGLPTEITPLAKGKVSDPFELDCNIEYWISTQPLGAYQNYAKVVNGSHTVLQADLCAFIRPAITVDQSMMHGIIYGYSEEFFKYYIDWLDNYRRYCFEHQDGKLAVKKKHYRLKKTNREPYEFGTS